MQTMIPKIEKRKVPYLIADIVGAVASALLLGIFHASEHVSDFCSSNPYRVHFDFVFLVISLLIYLSITYFVWRYHASFPRWLSSGRINWIFIWSLGLFVASTIWGLMNAFQCPLQFSDALIRAYSVALQTSLFFFFPVFFVPFLLALVAEAVIKDNARIRLK